MPVSIGFGIDNTTGYSSVSGTQTQQRVLSQDAVNKIIADVLGGDQGLSSLAQGENVSGLSGTSVKTMLAQDLVTKLVGEIANVTAPVITQADQRTDTGQTKKSGGLKTVICTELAYQGKLDLDLYWAGRDHFMSLSETTVRGYQVWAIPIAKRMRTSKWLSNFFEPIVQARYEYVVYGKFSLIGAATVHIGQPLCYLIGLFVPAGEQYGYTDA